MSEVFDRFNAYYTQNGKGGCTMPAAYAAWKDGVLNYDKSDPVLLEYKGMTPMVPSGFAAFWEKRKDTGEFRGADVSEVLAHWEQGQREGRAAKQYAGEPEPAQVVVSEQVEQLAQAVEQAKRPRAPKEKKTGAYKAEK